MYSAVFDCTVVGTRIIQEPKWSWDNFQLVEDSSTTQKDICGVRIFHYASGVCINYSIKKKVVLGAFWRGHT